MKKLLFCFLLLFVNCNIAQSEVTIVQPKSVIAGHGVTVREYLSPDDFELSTDVYKYRDNTHKSVIHYYERQARVISRPDTDMSSDGTVICCGRIKPKDEWKGISGWLMESLGTLTEFDTRRTLYWKRVAVYAIDKDGNVAKYDVHTLPKEHFWSLPKEQYIPVSVFKQTKREIAGKQRAEITEYDMQGNIISVYKRNTFDFIYEYDKNGKLKTRHETTYLPYLQWLDDEERKYICNPIETFSPSWDL